MFTANALRGMIDRAERQYAEAKRIEASPDHTHAQYIDASERYHDTRRHIDMALEQLCEAYQVAYAAQAEALGG